MLDGLAQNAARQEEAVAERVGLVHEQQVEPALERQVLEAVVEHQCVATKTRNGIRPRLHAILIHQHDDARQIARQHERLVAGQLGVEQHLLAVADDARRRRFSVVEPEPPLLPQRRRLALIAAGEDGDLAATVAQGLGKFFHDGGLAGAANRQVAHDHDQATEWLVAENPFAVKPEPQLHNAAEEIRAHLQERPEQHRPRPLAPPHDDVDGELLEFIDFMTKPAIGHE